MENYIQQIEGTSLIKHGSLWHHALINYLQNEFIYKILHQIITIFKKSSAMCRAPLKGIPQFQNVK
jgi:hypothetical protein